MKFRMSLSEFFAIIISNYFLICVSCEDSVAQDIENKEEKEANSDSRVKFVEYQTPKLNSESIHLYESFDDPRYFKSKWVQSEAIKRGASEFKYDGKWDLVATHHRIKGDYGIRMKNKSCHHAISTKLDKPFSFTGQPLIVQYDVQYRDGQDCGGAYIKLLESPSGNLSTLNDKTPFSLMFGPDKCGSDHKVHFIFVHKNKKNGKIREIHWKDSHTVSAMSDAITDRKWHNFRLIVSPDNTFEIKLDKIIVGKGSLLEEFNPPVNADPVIESDEKKPEDWDDREMIPDPDAIKPEDWDDSEPEKIPDPNVMMPEGWLEDEPLEIADPEAEAPADLSEDEFWEPPLIRNPSCVNVPGCGPWSPPLIKNPKYRGKWEPPMIPNSNYQGKWEPSKIPNPDYYEDNNPYEMLPIDGVAFELWTMNDGIVFDNVLITSDLNVASMIAEATYQVKRELNDEETDNWFKTLIKSTNKKPWLWAVYVIVIAVPLILFIGFCCVSPVHPSLNEHHRNMTHTHKSSHPFTCESHPIIHDRDIYHSNEASKFDEESDFPFTHASNQAQDTYGTFLPSHKIHQSTSSSSDRYMTILPEIREVRQVETEELDELEASQTDNIDFSINTESFRSVSSDLDYHGDQENICDGNNYYIDENSDWSHPNVHHQVPVDEESSAYFSFSGSGLQDDFGDHNQDSILTEPQVMDQKLEVAEKYEEIEDVTNKSDDEDIEESLCKKVTIDEHTVRRRKKRNRQQDNHNKKANTKSKSKKNRHQR